MEVFLRLCDLLARERSSSPLDVATSMAIVNLAEEERVFAALHEAIAEGGSDIMPKPFRAVLATHHQENLRRNAVIRQGLLELGEAAAAIGMQFVVLKGAAWLLEDSGGLASWRWLIDVDLLVDPRMFDAVPTFMERRGYEPIGSPDRFRWHFHHPPYLRSGFPASIEIHRHLGWRHDVLPAECMFAHARPVAPGFLMPEPWLRTFHAMVHWQIQDRGLSRGTTPLKDILEIARFMQRHQVDWTKLVAQARAADALDTCEASLALTSRLLAAPIPREFEIDESGKRHVARALARRASPPRAWLATQTWRAGTLWRCEKLSYRLAHNGTGPLAVKSAVWAIRTIRLPLMAARAAGIAARFLFIWMRGGSWKTHVSALARHIAVDDHSARIHDRTPLPAFEPFEK